MLPRMNTRLIWTLRANSWSGPRCWSQTLRRPKKLRPYEVQLPPGSWFNYWTGEKIDRRRPTGSTDLEIRDALNAGPKRIMIKPKLDELPVFVRAGSIVPMAPLVQSTAQRPSGPLTLRVFPGENCQGTVYQDDGVSFDFRKGLYFREQFSCSLAADGSVTVSLAQPVGSFQPWWTSIRIEVVGLDLTTTRASSGAKQLAITAMPLGVAAEVPGNGRAKTILFAKIAPTAAGR